MRVFKYFLLCLISLLLTACPADDEDCDDIGRVANVLDLVKLTPIQDQYNQGDIITMSLSIPSENTYFGQPVDIFAETGVTNARLISTAIIPLEGNEIRIINGFQDGEPGWFGVPYDPLSRSYNLEVQIKLNRVGSYSWISSDLIDFIGRDCQRLFIDTSVEWTFNSFISFEVVP